MPAGFWLMLLVLGSALTALGLIIGAVALVEWVAHLPGAAG